MTVATIRKRLINYLQDADDTKVKALYTLLSNDIEEMASFSLTDEQLAIVEERRSEYVSGKVKAIPWKEAHKDILDRRKKKA